MFQPENGDDIIIRAGGREEKLTLNPEVSPDRVPSEVDALADEYLEKGIILDKKPSKENKDELAA